MITNNLSALKIHKLSQAQYDRELAAGNIDETALYLTPDEGGSSSVSEDLINEKIAEAKLAMYPVGSIYISTTSTNPSGFIGGTWALFGQGKTLIGVDSNDTDFSTASKTGGSKTTTLASGNLPAHTHSVPAHAHGLNSHTHSVGAHAHGLNSHVHSIGAHSHGLNGHTHSIPSLSGTAASAGSHTHNADIKVISKKNEIGNDHARIASDGTVTGSNVVIVESAGAHTHSVSTNTSTTGGNTGSTANSSAFNSGGASGNTANSSAFNSGAASGNTANSSELTSGSVGSGSAFSNLQPYITVYMWQRTA